MTKKTVLGDLLKKENEKKKEIEIVIYKELHDLIPPLTSEELSGLEQSILAEGCREPILLWHHEGKAVIIDGHNRYNICKKNNIIFQKTEKQFETLDQVKDWMIANQLGRRNLSELQKSYLRGLQYSREKKKVGDRGQEKKMSQNVPSFTREKLAEEHKVSPKTIQRDEKFALGLDKLTEGNKELKDKILNKEVKIPQSIIQEATTWDKKQVKEAIKTIEKTGEYKPPKEVKEKPQDPKQEILREITDKLKTYSYEELLKVKKTLR